MIETDETMYDYLARLNMEGKRAVWIQSPINVFTINNTIAGYERVS